MGDEGVKVGEKEKSKMGEFEEDVIIFKDDCALLHSEFLSHFIPGLILSLTAKMPSTVKVCHTATQTLFSEVVQHNPAQPVSFPSY